MEYHEKNFSVKSGTPFGYHLEEGEGTHSRSNDSNVPSSPDAKGNQSTNQTIK
jgi:hypothetical protein